MKVRVWKHKTLPLRVIERNSLGRVKESADNTYDIQVKRHHIWCTAAEKLNKSECERRVGFDIK